MLVSGINFNSNKQSFKARSPELRYADDIMRRLNNQFQGVSLFQHEDFFQKNPDKLSKQQISKFKKLGNVLFYSKVTRPDFYCTPDEYVLKLIDDVSTNKLLNCREKSGLSKLGLAINGINSKIVSLYGHTKNGDIVDLDHLFPIVKLNTDAKIIDIKALNEKAYIIDTAEGIVDYAPNAFKKLESIFSKDIKENEIESLCLQVEDFNVGEKLIGELSKGFPSLKVPKEYYYR